MFSLKIKILHLNILEDALYLTKRGEELTSTVT